MRWAPVVARGRRPMCPFRSTRLPSRTNPPGHSSCQPSTVRARCAITVPCTAGGSSAGTPAAGLSPSTDTDPRVVRALTASGRDHHPIHRRLLRTCALSPRRVDAFCWAQRHRRGQTRRAAATGYTGLIVHPPSRRHVRSALADAPLSLHTRPGSAHTCALTDAELFTAGATTGTGQLGGATQKLRTTPAAVDTTGVLSGKTPRRHGRGRESHLRGVGQGPSLLLGSEHTRASWATAPRSRQLCRLRCAPAECWTVSRSSRSPRVPTTPARPTPSARSTAGGRIAGASSATLVRNDSTVPVAVDAVRKPRWCHGRTGRRRWGDDVRARL